MVHAKGKWFKKKIHHHARCLTDATLLAAMTELGRFCHQ